MDVRTTRRITAASLLAAAMLALGPTAATLGAQPAANHVDDFEDGTTQGWGVGDLTHPAPPSVVAGGWKGLEDHFLMLSSFGGQGPGSRMSVLNFSQWSGNFLAAGYAGIGMYVRNFGTEDLFLRLLFVNFPVAGPPTDAAASLNAIHVPAGSDWMRIVFPIDLASLGSVGFGTPAGALSDVNELRLFHNPEFGFGGPNVGAPAVNALLGVDDVHVTPEPGTMVLLGTGVAAMFARVRRKRS